MNRYQEAIRRLLADHPIGYPPVPVEEIHDSLGHEIVAELAPRPAQVEILPNGWAEVKDVP